MLRVLCFHGWGTNSEMMQYQLRYFIKFFPEMEFVCLEGPDIIPERYMADPGVQKVVKEKKFYAWKAHSASELLYRENIDFNKSIEHVTNYINKEGPFDGVCGFSQGGLMAQKFLQACEDGSLKDKLKVEQPRFAIFCSGVFEKNLYSTLKTPSIHLIGLKDFTIEAGLILTTYFLNPLILKHAETHKFPKLNQFDLDSIRSYLKNIPGLKKKIESKTNTPLPKL